MVNKNIIKKIENVIKQFPLKDFVEINENSEISNVINMFSSLLVERVKARLADEFPSYNFDDMQPNSTINDIKNLILNQNKSKSFKNNNEEELINETNKANTIYNFETENTLYGLGTDIENLEALPNEIFSIAETTFRQNLFTEHEISYALMKENPKLTLLGIFSAKESIIKALNLKTKIQYNCIQIIHTKEGKPYASVRGYLNKQFKLSISHSKDYAMSTCLFFK